MDYLDFYDIAEYGSEHWKGKFTPREIAENAYIYKTEYDTFGLTSNVIKELVNLLETDDSNEAIFWLEELRRFE